MIYSQILLQQDFDILAFCLFVLKGGLGPAVCLLFSYIPDEPTEKSLWLPSQESLLLFGVTQ